MKVVLRSDVEGLGTTGQILDVSDGYARNHLIPRALAMPASAGAIKQSKDMARAHTARVGRARETAETIAAKLTSEGVTIEARAGSGEQLYGSVTSTEIADAVATLVGEDVDRRKLSVESPIKTLGTHKVSAQLHDDVKCTFSVEVVAAAE